MAQETLAQAFLRYVHEDLLQIRHPHFDIAFRLFEAKQLGYAAELGYSDIYELSDVEFGFKKSSTAAYISVCEVFMGGVTPVRWDNRWKEFGFSQLVELLPMSPSDRMFIKPTMTVKQIREWRKNHTFVHLGSEYRLYGDLSPREQAVYDAQVELKKAAKKVAPEIVVEGSDEFQTSGMERVAHQSVVVKSSVVVPKTTKLGLKNLKSRDEWLSTYKDWGIWLSVPELDLTVYKYVFANGDVLCVSESYTFYDMLRYPKELIVRYHLIESNSNRNFFDYSGNSKTFILAYMTKNAGVL